MNFKLCIWLFISSVLVINTSSKLTGDTGEAYKVGDDYDEYSYEDYEDNTAGIPTSIQPTTEAIMTTTTTQRPTTTTKAVNVECEAEFKNILIDAISKSSLPAFLKKAMKPKSPKNKKRTTTNRIRKTTKPLLQDFKGLTSMPTASKLHSDKVIQIPVNTNKGPMVNKMTTKMPVTTTSSTTDPYITKNTSQSITDSITPNEVLSMNDTSATYAKGTDSSSSTEIIHIGSKARRSILDNHQRFSNNVKERCESEFQEMWSAAFSRPLFGSILKKALKGTGYP